MTEQDIKNMATIAFAECDHIPNTKIPKEFVIAFAHLVANKEREECARICDDMNSMSDYYGLRIELVCAYAIRARGQE